MLLAIGSSLPQTYITLQNISQNEPYSAFLNICAFLGGIPAGYWAMQEIYDLVAIQIQNMMCAEQPLTTLEKRRVLISMCKKFHQEIYNLPKDELSELHKMLLRQKRERGHRVL